MQLLEKVLGQLESWVWGAPLLFLVTFVGLFLTIRLKGIQFRHLGTSLRLAFTRDDAKAEGDISQFQSLMTALAGMIGIGSITGVATAVAMGGLGSLFWMWVASLIGMATKYAEAILAVKYRTLDEKGEMCGGPMYYLEKGLKSKWLAIFFAVAGSITALGTGNMVQANSIAAAVQGCFAIDPIYVGIFLVLVTGFALFKGIKSIGKVSSWLVPAMAVFYLGGGVLVLCLGAEALPGALAAIFREAFTGKAIGGGAVGGSLMMAIQYGFSRSVFSSEAGLGSAPIAAAAAKTDVPGRQALISMSGVFITSILVCSITGLAIAVSGLLGQPGEGGLNGATLTMGAFEAMLPGGGWIVAISLILFGYSTILGWAYYGEKCMEYLFGIRVVVWYRLFFIAFLIPGSLLSLTTVWSFANLMNGLMAFPNLIGLFALASVVMQETRSFEALLRFEGKKTAS